MIRVIESLGVFAEELGLGDYGFAKFVDQHALVRRVDIAEAVRRAK